MRIILITLIIFINYLQLSADVSIRHYYLTGTVKLGKSEVCKNSEVYIIQGDFKKIVRTDHEGKYKIRVRYLKPCLSGGNKKYTDAKVLKLASQYNGDKLNIYIPSKRIVLSENLTWMDYYLGQKKDSDITVLDIDLEKATNVVSSDQNMEIFKETRQKIEEAYLRMASRNMDNIYDCHSQNEDLKFIINEFDFTGQTLKYFLDRTSIKSSELKISKTKKSTWSYQVCNMYSIKVLIEIKLSINDIVEEIRM